MKRNAYIFRLGIFRAQIHDTFPFMTFTSDKCYTGLRKLEENRRKSQLRKYVFIKVVEKVHDEHMQGYGGK